MALCLGTGVSVINNPYTPYYLLQERLTACEEPAALRSPLAYPQKEGKNLSHRPP